jgi:co-chaperonin GroES (HSP10)
VGQIPSLEECNAGLTPVEFNVLVVPETVETKTAGGIFLPDQKKETDQLAATKGRIVAASVLAFTYETWPEGARKPAVGDVVWFARYGGTLVTGEDGREYRLLKDKDVAAIVI